MKRISHLVFALCALLMGGCVTSRNLPAPPSTPAKGGGGALQAVKINHSAFMLDVGDVIEVRVYGEKGLSGAYQIYPNCTIRFPMLKQVKVCGRTPGQVEKEIALRLYHDFFRQLPTVVIKVSQYNSKKIHVFGEVKKPGRYSYSMSLTLLQVIAMSGGFSRRAAKNDTRLIRVVNGVKRIYRVRLGNLGKRNIRDLYLRPGDIIYIPESWI